MEGLTSLPSLDGLTSLQTLNLNGCSGLTSLPSLDGLTALRLTWALQQLHLTALQHLQVFRRCRSTG